MTARIVRDKATGRSRGFAYVEFSEEGALQVAIMRDGVEYQGRKLSIARSMPKPPGGDGVKKGDKSGGSRVAPPGAIVSQQRRGPKGLGFAGMMPRAARVQAQASGVPSAVVAATAKGASGDNGNKPHGAVPTQKNAADGSTGSGGDKPKSNADFRAMFLSGFKKGANLE